MHFRSRTQIHVDVIHACDWFEKKGIPIAGTRLEQIRGYFEELLNPTTSEEKSLEVKATEIDTYYAMSDGAGFSLIASEMSKLPSHLLPRRTLRDILDGPLAASKEDPSSSDSRNKFVELELAAHFSSAGLHLLGFDDLKFDFEGHTYLVECKRPSHRGTLDDNIEKAYTQLRAKLDHSSDRGIVAVAVEKVFGLEGRIYPVESPAAATDFAKSIAKEFGSMVSKYERTWVDPRIVGVLAIIRFLTNTNVPGLTSASYVLGLLKFASPKTGQAAENGRLDRLIEILRTKFLGGWRDLTKWS
jgi:hypothetical protein